VELLGDELRDVQFVHCNRNPNRIANDIGKYDLANYACREMTNYNPNMHYKS
jgi:hypothetical protein